MTIGPQERMRRWRLILGGADDGTGTSLGGDDARIDAALSALYDSDADQGSGSHAARRRLPRRLGGCTAVGLAVEIENHGWSESR